MQFLQAISCIVILFDLTPILHCKPVPQLPDVQHQSLNSCQIIHRVRRSFQGLHLASGAWTSSRGSPQHRATRTSLPWEARLGVRGAQSLQEPGAKAQASLLVGPPVIVLYVLVQPSQEHCQELCLMHACCQLADILLRHLDKMISGGSCQSNE